MYNFSLLKNEKVIDVFDDIWVSQNENEKMTTVALTNQRLLFLDYNNNDPRDNLRIGRGMEYIRYKEVYHSIMLQDIKDVTDVYILNLKKGCDIKIDNKELCNLIKKQIKNVANDNAS